MSSAAVILSFLFIEFKPVFSRLSCYMTILLHMGLGAIHGTSSNCSKFIFIRLWSVVSVSWRHAVVSDQWAAIWTDNKKKQRLKMTNGNRNVKLQKLLVNIFRCLKCAFQLSRDDWTHLNQCVNWPLFYIGSKSHSSQRRLEI